MYPLEKIVLFEYDLPLDLNKMLNAEPGIFSWKIAQENSIFTDDRDLIGYYQYVSESKINIKSLRIDNEPFTRVLNLNEVRQTNKSFFYDTDTFLLYIHFDNNEPPLGKDIVYGATTGYSKIPDNTIKPFYGSTYYRPLLSNVPNVKKSIDPLFFGLLRYTKASVSLTNKDGEFDDWRDRNLFGQGARILVGDKTDTYDNFDTIVEGFISDDSRDFDSFTVKIEDPRRNLSQPVATNKLTQTDWPDLSDSNVDVVKPVAYGQIFNAESICLNEDDASAADRIFLICDTEFNSVISLDTIYVDGVETTITGSTDLSAGTFTMTKASVFDNFDNVSIDFTATSSASDDGVSIIKDLMLNYDNKPFIESLWDIDEVNAASSRDTSIYIDSGSDKLSEVIEKICVDIDGRFFVKNNGLYTIRIYDQDRTPNEKELNQYEFIGYPKIKNNGSQFLSSVIIKYKQDLKDDKSLTYENTDFIDEVFDRYKKKKVGEYDTMLTTLSAAQDKSNTIMNISKNVQDIVNRDTSWINFGIEPSDFIIGSPASRDNETPVRNIYEVMGVENNLKNFTIGLSLREVKLADPLQVFDSIDDNNDLTINDSNNENLIGRIS